ncbi:MAG: Gx transporter family protein [Gammaproteobacteria bacterium]|nr:Gx transporter family protein [Gammaproteobacteria bacterium]
MKQVIQSTTEDHLIAWLAAFAITIHIAESALPSPLPGVKPGLANVVTLVTLLLLGWRAAVWVSLLRVLVGSLIIGTFLTPTFFLSLSGACSSLLALGIAAFCSARITSLAIGPLGYSIIAAMAHMLGQFYAAYWLFIPHNALFQLLPPLMTAAVIFGMVSGLIAARVSKQLKNSPELQPLLQQGGGKIRAATRAISKTN